jgi:hypothetical protein
MNLLHFSGDENASNRQLRRMFTTRRKPARRFSPAVDGLESRQLLSTVGFGSDGSVRFISDISTVDYGTDFRMNPASPKAIVSEGLVVVTDIQKVREAAVVVSNSATGKLLGTELMAGFLNQKNYFPNARGNHYGNNGATAAIQGAQYANN